MPVSICLSIIIVDKKAIKKKYKGGIVEFKKNYRWDKDSNNEEDDELFSIASMNSVEHEIEKLTSKGLSFDARLQRSDDFTIVRYGCPQWSVSWLQNCYSFAWHIDADENFIQKAKATDEMTGKRFAELVKEGINPFIAIRSW